MVPILDILSIGGKIINSHSGVFYQDCNDCDRELPSKMFRVRTDSKNKQRRPFCFDCESGKRKELYKENKTEVRAKAQIYYENNYLKKRMYQLAATAKRKNLEFNIEEEDLVVPEFCPYLGVRLTQVVGSGVVWDNLSVDRIDSSKGYIKGNIQIMSRKANSMKNMATEEELLAFAKNVLLIHGAKNVTPS
jgi:hypothetical protein